MLAVNDDAEIERGPLKAPFPYFGGKSRVASIVWDALGDVNNYVEPFAGSLAVLLSRPSEPKIETVNDMDCMLANFWRAVKAAPDAVAEHADWPVNEVDLEARHYWLVQKKPSIRDAMGDTAWYDAKSAGWWVWGISAWIGGGWCSGSGPWHHDGAAWDKQTGAGMGVNRQLPHLTGEGKGVNRKTSGVYDVMHRLSRRLRGVRVCCGDWSRVCGPTPTYKNGLTGVFLDPPYAVEDRDVVYNEESFSVARDVTAWALTVGDRPDMRIIVAGYEGEHSSLTDAGWRVVAWKAHGGYGSSGVGRGRDNKHRERLWLSPHCLSTETRGKPGSDLFTAPPST